MPGDEPVKPTPAGIKLTYDDFLLFPDDGMRHELVDGEHCVTPSPSTRHQTVLWNLVTVLAAYLDAHPVGRAFTAPLDVLFSDVDVVEPDLLYTSQARAAEIVTPQHVRGAPDLVVEIGSPHTRQRDETAKRRLYERGGVVEYWFVDPEVDTVRVYRRDGNTFARPVELSREAGEVLTTALLPGLQIPLLAVFRA